uniref:Uncharacterized protein n=1 Tax=Anopheles atroparvus TaxID=41427 RepID=A0AAG5CNQ3_ANOAO
MYSSISDGVSAELAGARAGYRREFEEMESRIRKCERQRAELELQFGELMRERAESERAAARAKKQRHKRLMEAERQRAERNESILRMLNKIDQQAASLAAKTDRLKMLKTQYEMYLMRTYSSVQPSVSAYNPPMIAAPPTMLPKAPQSPSKSCFAQYLSDLTHQQQQASIDPIPPPTALSNYLATQQKPFIQSSSYAAPIERPYSRMFDRGVPWEADEAQRHSATAGSEAGGAKSKRFDMSNEDFIRYIDSEVLKEPIPTVSVVAPSPEGNSTMEQVRGAYLEDAGMSEDEPVVIDQLVEGVEQFSIVPKENVPKNVDWKDVDGEAALLRPETREEDTSVVTKDHAQPQPLLEEALHNEPDYQAEEQVYTSKTEPPPNSEVTALYKGLGEGQLSDDLVDRIAPQEVQEHYDASQAVVAQQPVEGSTLVQFKEPEYIPEYPGEQQDATYQQQTVYGSEENGSSQAYNEQLYEKPDGDEHIETLAHAVEQRPVEDIHLPNALQSSQEYNPEQHPSNNEVYTEAQPQPLQRVQQMMHQPTAGGQRWSTARQAMRSKAFPGVSSKPPSPEMKLPVEESYEPTSQIETAQKSEDHADPNLGQGHYEGDDTSGSVENTAQNAEAYPDYATGTNDQSYYTPTTVEEPTVDLQSATSPAVSYPDDGMGQPIEYQTGPLDDSQQAGVYQYQQADGRQATYQEGQYAEGSSSGTMQYQYAEGADQTVAPYGTQEGYHDPDQQYQYDQTAYYDQQQQGYEGQYYSEDPQQQQDEQQQQQQQYYMEDPNQQQQGQYEQQILNQGQEQQNHPVDHYQPGDQGDYPTDPAKYEPSSRQPASTNGADQTPASDEPTSEPSKVVVSQTTSDAPSVESTPASDAASTPKANPEKNSSKGKQTNDPKPAKNDAEPASDTPTVSTVNDESDFDFSTQ